MVFLYKRKHKASLGLSARSLQNVIWIACGITLAAHRMSVQRRPAGCRAHRVSTLCRLAMRYYMHSTQYTRHKIHRFTVEVCFVTHMFPRGRYHTNGLSEMSLQVEWAILNTMEFILNVMMLYCIWRGPPRVLATRRRTALAGLSVTTRPYRSRRPHMD